MFAWTFLVSAITLFINKAIRFEYKNMSQLSWLFTVTINHDSISQRSEGSHTHEYETYNEQIQHLMWSIHHVPRHLDGANHPRTAAISASSSSRVSPSANEPAISFPASLFSSLFCSRRLIQSSFNTGGIISAVDEPASAQANQMRAWTLNKMTATM